MKKLGWQILIMSMVALSACHQKEDVSKTEAKEVVMTAEAADPVAKNDEHQKSQELILATDEKPADLELADDVDGEQITEAIDFDEKDAATATADAEVEDEASK